MSFNRLPTEIKQLIVDQAAYFDMAHRGRKLTGPNARERSKKRREFNEEYGRGPEAISSLSRVKVIRELCYPHLFSVR